MSGERCLVGPQQSGTAKRRVVGRYRRVQEDVFSVLVGLPVVLRCTRRYRGGK